MKLLSPRRRAAALCLATVLAAAPVALAQQHAHQHGLVRLDLAIEADGAQLMLDAPLDSLLGFERAPRTAAERARADALLARLRDTGAPLVAFDAAAGCTLKAAQAESAVLQPGAAATEHADLEASFTFSCRAPARISQLDVAVLLKAFAHIARIELQVAGPAGQHRQALKRPATVLRWGR